MEVCRKCETILVIGENWYRSFAEAWGPNRLCKSCANDRVKGVYQPTYQERHPDRVKATRRRCYHANYADPVRRAKMNAQCSAYAKANREKVNASKRAYYQRNREKVLEKRRLWNEANPGKLREYNRQYYLRKKAMKEDK